MCIKEHTWNHVPTVVVVSAAGSIVKLTRPSTPTVSTVVVRHLNIYDVVMRFDTFSSTEFGRKNSHSLIYYFWSDRLPWRAVLPSQAEGSQTLTMYLFNVKSGLKVTKAAERP